MRKLETTVTINKPAQVVWDYMNDPDNMSKWLDNFDHYEHVSGAPGEKGSKGRHYYNEKGREFIMDEEVIDEIEPEFIKLRLTSKPMDMIIENYFKSPAKDVTEYTAIAEFTRVSTFMKLMMTLFMSKKKAQAQHEEQIRKLKTLIEQS